MASLSLHPQFETNLTSNRKVIERLLQLISARTHGKNYKPDLPDPPSLRYRLFNLPFLLCHKSLCREVRVHQQKNQQSSSKRKQY